MPTLASYHRQRIPAKQAVIQDEEASPSLEEAEQLVEFANMYSTHVGNVLIGPESVAVSQL